MYIYVYMYECTGLQCKMYFLKEECLNFAVVGVGKPMNSFSQGSVIISLSVS